MDFFGWSSEIHRTGIGDVEQQEGFEEKKEGPFSLPLVLFPSLIIDFYSHNIVLAVSWTLAWTSLDQRLTEGSAPRLVKLQHFLRLNCTSGSRELHGYYLEIKASLKAHILYTLFREFLVITCFLLLSSITLHRQKNISLCRDHIHPIPHLLRPRPPLSSSSLVTCIR